MAPFSRCPKCGHRPLPHDQALPAACPACGVILAKVAASMHRPHASAGAQPQSQATPSRPVHAEPLWPARPGGPAGLDPLSPAARTDPTTLAARALLLAAFAVWGVVLIAQDLATGAMARSFIHLPLLVFHEAGHVIFMPLGEWVSVLGGSLGQLLMPAILSIALWRVRRDAFGAAIGIWLLGVSLLDVAPYMYDALDPQLMLLSGSTGEEGGHDWIRLFSSMGLLGKAQSIGRATHHLGAAVVLLALGWAGTVLHRQWQDLRPVGRAA